MKTVVLIQPLLLSNLYTKVLYIIIKKTNQRQHNEGKVLLLKLLDKKKFEIYIFRRKTCSLCLNVSSECAWCENLRTCLPFSDYVSRYRHGQCTEWIDSEVTSSTNKHTCRDCSAKHTCDECLDMFSCGWCGNTVNPTIGVCFEGDYAGHCSVLSPKCSIPHALKGFDDTELIINYIKFWST